MDRHEDYKARIDAVRRTIDGGAHVVAQAVALAREGLAQAYPPTLVIDACVCAAQGTRQEDPALATQLLQRAQRLARAHALDAEAMGLRLRLAEVRFSMGDHAEGFDQLVALAGSPDLLRMHPAARVRLFLVLAVHSLAVDPDDSVSLCLRLAHRAWDGQPGPLPLDYRAWELGIRATQASYACEALRTRLARPAWDSQRRQQVIQTLGIEARRLEAEPGWHEAAVASRSWTMVIAALMPALAARDHAGVVGTLRLIESLPDDDPHEEEDCRYWAVTALLELGDAGTARAVLASMEPVRPGPHWALQLNWLHLRSAVARAEGDAAAAIDLYEAYVAAAARYLPRMNLRVPQLLKSLTRLPGGRPTDTRDQRPAYLDRALARLAATGPEPTVPELAAAAGVSERTLREAFATHLGATPKDYLLRERLHAARATLEQAPQLSVEEVAARHGFGHPGRFAAKYRAAFGHLPGRTRQP